MLPPNLLIVSVLILLAATVSTAPVEEKEQEEIEVEVTETMEGEVSEEEEDDDDDSKSQDKIMGVQQTTVSAAPAGGSGVSPNIQDLSASSGQSVGRGPHDGAAGGSTGHGIDSSLHSAGEHPGSSSGSLGFVGSAVASGSGVASGSAVASGSGVASGSAVASGSGVASVSGVASGSVSSADSIAVDLSGVSAGQTHSSGARDPSASSHADIQGPGGENLGSNGNGQKLLNGGGGGAGVDGQAGDLGPLGEEVSHLDYTGIIDPSSHDYLLGLIGGGPMDPISTDSHVNIPGHMTPPTHLDVPVIGSGVTAGPSVEQNILDSPGGTVITSTDLVHQSEGSIDQSGGGGTSLISGSDQSLSSSLSGSSYSEVASSSSSSSSSSGGAAQGEHAVILTDSADSPDALGNGRQTYLTDTNQVTERQVSFSELQTQSLINDLTGGTESVTSLHIDITGSSLQRAHEVTELSPVTSNAESANGITNTLSPVSGVYSQTDQVTIAAGTDPVPADPTGNPLDSSHPAVTDHMQMAGSVTEQYNPSGQGPEGAENVELEDTC